MTAKIINLKRGKREVKLSDEKTRRIQVEPVEPTEPIKPFPVVSSENPLVEWQARDHVPPERSFGWYTGIIIIAAAIIAYAVFTLNFLFAFFVVLAAAAVIAASRLKPPKYNITIFPDGVHIDSAATFTFSEIDSFWIFPGTTPPMLSLRPRKRIKMHAHILLENVDPEKVRAVLLNYLPEQEEEFPFAERISRWMGF